MNKEEESNHHKEKERSSRHIIFFKLQNIIFIFLHFCLLTVVVEVDGFVPEVLAWH